MRKSAAHPRFVGKPFDPQHLIDRAKQILRCSVRPAIPACDVDESLDRWVVAATAREPFDSFFVALSRIGTLRDRLARSLGRRSLSWLLAPPALRVRSSSMAYFTSAALVDAGKLDRRPSDARADPIRSCADADARTRSRPVTPRRASRARRRCPVRPRRGARRALRPRRADRVLARVRRRPLPARRDRRSDARAARR